MTLHCHAFGPADGAPVLAVHGLGGHGGRWRELAATELARARVLAPDLRGHGRSPWEPPWTLEAHTRDLLDVLDAHDVARATVLAHSFGAAVALHLAAAAPGRVHALVLLDPAVQVDPARAAEAATDACAPGVWDTVDAAGADKAGDWDGVALQRVQAEVAEHLATLADGRHAWRTCAPALVTAWSEMTRPGVLPPADTRTVWVPAGRVTPPFTDPAYRTALAVHLGDHLAEHPLDCAHMVAQLHPADVGALVRPLLAP